MFSFNKKTIIPLLLKQTEWCTTNRSTTFVSIVTIVGTPMSYALERRIFGGDWLKSYAICKCFSWKIRALRVRFFSYYLTFYGTHELRGLPKNLVETDWLSLQRVAHGCPPKSGGYLWDLKIQKHSHSLGSLKPILSTE